MDENKVLYGAIATKQKDRNFFNKKLKKCIENK